VKKIIIILLFLVLFSSFTYAKPVIVQEITGLNSGLILEYPKYDRLLIDTHYYLHVHVYNFSDGKRLEENVTNCSIDIYNATGDEILGRNLTYDYENKEFELYINEGNFSELGLYSYIIECYEGGAVSGNFEVVRTLDEFTTDKAITYSFFLMALIIFFLSTSIGAYIIDGKDEYNLLGKLVKINYKKHLKSFLFFISYAILIMISFVVDRIAYYYLMDSIIYNVLHFTYSMLWILLFPVIIIFIAVTIIKIMDDSKLMDLSKRNLKEFGK